MSQKSFYFDDYSIVGFEGLKRNDFNLNPVYLASLQGVEYSATDS